jgi:hypothetical protein
LDEEQNGQLCCHRQQDDKEKEKSERLSSVSVLKICSGNKSLNVIAAVIIVLYNTSMQSK